MTENLSEKKHLPPEANCYPSLILRDIVLLPQPDIITPLFIGRERSIRTVQAVVDGDLPLFLITQKDQTLDNPEPSDLYEIGVMGKVVELSELPNGVVKVLVKSFQRAKAIGYVQKDQKYFQAYALPLESTWPDDIAFEALRRTLIQRFEKYIKLLDKSPKNILGQLMTMTDMSQWTDLLALQLPLNVEDRQSLLESLEVGERIERLLLLLQKETEIALMQKKIAGRIKMQHETEQRVYILNEQLKAIQKEINFLREQGDSNLAQEGSGDEGTVFQELAAKKKLSQEAREKVRDEIKKLRQMNSLSPEAAVTRNYLDVLLGLPWNEKTRIQNDLGKAEKILEGNHYGLARIKERILEHLSVQQRVGKMQGSVLCLVGPPGVGKTSLGQSIAKATGRHFGRIALGGLRDESEIRGHRRTYIGAMPGKIIQAMRKAKSSNPLILLDEVDKMGSDWRGDPASVFLEVLDPSQNHAFNDHYLEVDYDLSDVLFITTANTLNMPPALVDRLEIIRLPGYTEDEKMEIAKQHIIPRQKRIHKLSGKEFSISTGALQVLIQNYCREAGVRQLEREISKLARKATFELTKKTSSRVFFTPKNLATYSGPPRYLKNIAEEKDLVGITTGLAWTEVGGEILSIEALILPGKGKMILTGKLGEVMQESIQAASSFVRARAESYGIAVSSFETKDIHIHVPEGATPKDGPSAGVAMCTSIVSSLTGIPVRKDTAMTGEISLKGRVLPIGGLKEKLLAAHYAGITYVLIPEGNIKDLSEIPDNIKQKLSIIPVATVDEVLRLSLSQPLMPLLLSPNASQPAPAA